MECPDSHYLGPPYVSKLSSCSKLGEERKKRSLLLKSVFLFILGSDMGSKSSKCKLPDEDLEFLMVNTRFVDIHKKKNSK